MGKLFDDFGSLVFHNEAEVSQNFILPLLQNYLAYDLKEILPEHYYAAKDIFSGVKFSEGGSKSHNHKPDFVICLDGDQGQARFIIDSKGPGEDINDHFGQLRSYAVSVGRNFLMMTNGRELKVYDVNTLLFYSADMADLQDKLGLLVDLLGRDNQALKSEVNIIKAFDHEQAVSVTGKSAEELELQRKKVLLADFRAYLQTLRERLEGWHLPTVHFRAINNLDARKIDPNVLLSFREHRPGTEWRPEEKPLKLQQIENEAAVRIKVLVGETGTGKTALLRYLTHCAALCALDYRETRIPVLVSLREIGTGNRLEDLVVAELNRNGYPCASFYALPEKNDFVFYLDAYDEVGEEFRAGVFKGVEILGRKYTCLVTTRPGALPNFRPSVAYDLLPLADSQVDAIASGHLNDHCYEFRRQVEAHGLRTESGNILLLLFLISLFKESGRLPATASKVIAAIADRVRTWQNSKHPHSRAVKWDALEPFLAVLALELFQTGETALTRTVAEPLLLDTLTGVDQLRRLPAGMTTDTVLNLLERTGLLICSHDHLYFWHRLFLNYFAALALKVQYEQDPSVIGPLLSNERWDIVIIGLAALLPSVTGLVRLLRDKPWLPGYCLIENNRCEAEEAGLVIAGLIRLAASPVADVRQKAARYLGAIDMDAARRFFFGVFDGDYMADIRMMALSTIGKTRSAEAKAILEQYLDWDEGAFLTGPSARANVARGLSYYGETEHLQIVGLWKLSGDYLMNQECRRIFMELHSQGKLSEKVVQALKDLYLDEYRTKEHGGEKLRTLAGILALVPDDAFAAEVLELCSVDRELMKVDSIYELLRHYRSLAVIELVKAKVFSTGVEYYTKEKLAEIIVDSAAEVTKEIYIELMGHADSNIAARAIGALKRFPYADVRDVVEAHLYGLQPQLQGWAVGVLVDNGELLRFIRAGRFPINFYGPAAHELLKGVRRFHLTEALPLMDRVKEALAKNKVYAFEVSLAMDLAGTYEYIGERDRQAKVVGWFFASGVFRQKSDNLHFHLLRNLKYLDAGLALEIASCYFRTYLERGDGERFKTDTFLQAVDDLGQPELLPLVKKIVGVQLAEAQQGNKQSGFELERPMRSLVRLFGPADEDWLLERLEGLNFNDGFEFPQLRRAAECLAFGGTAKSLPYIRRIAGQHMDSEMLLNVCLYAYEQICLREKMAFEPEDLFVTSA